MSTRARLGILCRDFNAMAVLNMFHNYREEGILSWQGSRDPVQRWCTKDGSLLTRVNERTVDGHEKAE